MKKIILTILLTMVAINMYSLDIHIYQGIDTVYAGANIVPDSTQTLGTPTHKWPVGYFDSLPNFAFTDSIQAWLSQKLDTSWWMAWKGDSVRIIIHDSTVIKLDTSWWNAWRDTIANKFDSDTLIAKDLLETDFIKNTKESRISLLGMTQIPRGAINSAKDTVHIGSVTITAFSQGDMFYDTLNLYSMIYNNGEWQIFGYRVRYVDAYINAIDSLPSIAQNTWTPLNFWTQGYNKDITLTGDSMIISGQSGRYKISYSLSLKCNQINHLLQFGISKNNAVPAVGNRVYKRFIANEWHSIACHSILDLTSADTLRVVVMDTTGGSSLYFLRGDVIVEEIRGGTR